MLRFSTGTGLLPATEKVGNTTPRHMHRQFLREGGGGDGGEACNWVGGNSTCSIASEEMFGLFCALDGGASLVLVDECFMIERVSPPHGQEILAEHENRGSEIGVGLLYDSSLSQQ